MDGINYPCPNLSQSMLVKGGLERGDCNSKNIIFQLISGIDFWSTSSEITPRWMLQDFISFKST